MRRRLLVRVLLILDSDDEGEGTKEGSFSIKRGFLDSSKLRTRRFALTSAAVVIDGVGSDVSADKVRWRRRPGWVGGGLKMFAVSEVGVMGSKTGIACSRACAWLLCESSMAEVVGWRADVTVG